MGSWLTGIIGLGVVAFSAGLLLLHWREWTALRAEPLPLPKGRESEYRYRRRRLRRRVQTSTLVGLVGVGMIAAVALRRLGASPIWIVCTWSAVLFLLLWICLLAMADIIETQRHYGRARHEVVVEEAKWLAKLRGSGGPSPSAPTANNTPSGDGKLAKGQGGR